MILKSKLDVDPQKSKQLQGKNILNPSYIDKEYLDLQGEGGGTKCINELMEL